MDAVKFLKEWGRLCEGRSCHECPIYIADTGCWTHVRHPEKAVGIIEQWSKDHPAQKTGRWIDESIVTKGNHRIDEWQSCRCSVCGRYDTRPYTYYFDEPNYCSYCGTRMVGEEDG